MEDKDALREEFLRLVGGLESGKRRAAVKSGGRWIPDTYVKETILKGFRAGVVRDMSQGDFSFMDKDTMPLRRFTVSDGVRIVPGGSSVRCGAYVAPSVVIMPPCYVNIGAYVDEGTMLDSHSLVGSCAQIGKGVHLSAGSQIGGVLEPAGALPVIVEDGAFIGGNCGIYEGTVIGEKAVIASGVILTGATPIFDATVGKFLDCGSSGVRVIPPGAVVVAGSRPMRGAEEAGIHLYTPVIVKYRDGRTDAATELESALR